jgi:hypothetical protein
VLKLIVPARNGRAVGPRADIAAKGPERRLAARAEHPLAEAVNG